MTDRITVPVPGLVLGLTLLLALLSGAALAPGASAAGKVAANLRVVTWKGQVLYDGKVRTGSVQIKPNANCLGGSAGAARTVTGPTAIGLLAQAARKPSGKAIRNAVRKVGRNTVKRALKRAARLRPLTISDGDFGFGICGIGGNQATGEQWWSLRNNYRDSTTGAELATVKRNDSVLFYLAKTWNEPTPDAQVGS